MQLYLYFKYNQICYWTVFFKFFKYRDFFFNIKYVLQNFIQQLYQLIKKIYKDCVCVCVYGGAIEYCFDKGKYDFQNLFEYFFLKK